jgi:recombination protein RecT
MKNHVVTDPGPGEMGYGCKCGLRFATRKLADAHAGDQILIEDNAAKAAAAELQRQADAAAALAAGAPTKPQEPAQAPKTEKPANEPAKPAGTDQKAPEAPKPPTHQNNGLTTVSVQSYLRSGAVQERVSELLGKRSGEFTTSLMTAVNTNLVLQDCEPSSIVTAALTAASMNLPINPNLGFAHIVPYNDGKSKTRKAQFQMGWKGFVQLAQRTGRYKTVNAGDVRAGEYQGKNRLTGGIAFHWEDDDAKREKLPVVGYFAYFELHDGFSKILYMTVDELKAHAKKYSQSYRKGYGLWVDNFPVMALKTVIKLLVSKFGPMSTELEKALVADQAAVGDDTVDYVDNKKFPEPEEGELVEVGDGE